MAGRRNAQIRLFRATVAGRAEKPVTANGLHYSVGMTITQDMQEAIVALPARIWEPADDAGGQARPGAWVAEITGLLDLSGWPAGMRAVVGKERPQPGAQLRFTDINGHRFTTFATDAGRGQLADLERRQGARGRGGPPAGRAAHTGPPPQASPRLTSRTTSDKKRKQAPPTRATAAARTARHGQALKTAASRSLSQTDQDRETSRLGDPAWPPGYLAGLNMVPLDQAERAIRPYRPLSIRVYLALRVVHGKVSRELAIRRFTVIT